METSTQRSEDPLLGINLQSKPVNRKPHKPEELRWMLNEEKKVDARLMCQQLPSDPFANR